MEPSDQELVLGAQSGDTGSLATLLTRHRAAMHAVAASVLGAGPEVEDVVQDASLVAITDIGRIRDPARARAWLTGTTRNLALGRIRRPAPRPIAHLDVPAVDDLERRLEETALRDWVWLAIGGLSEPLWAVVVLRYFSAARTYQAIAEALDIPVGTVRSRLHDARAALAPRLRQLDLSAGDDYVRSDRVREELFAAIVDEYNAGDQLGLLGDLLAREARLTVAAGEEAIVGRTAITRSLSEDLEAGIHLRLLRIVPGTDLTVVEGAFQNPPDLPDHCPPFTTQVYRHRGEEIVGVHLAYSSG